MRLAIRSSINSWLRTSARFGSERSREMYALWRAAGADRYLLRNKTTDAALYKSIRATTAMETMVPRGREIILTSGANVVMQNVTEGDYRRKYALYPGKICALIRRRTAAPVWAGASRRSATTLRRHLWCFCHG